MENNLSLNEKIIYAAGIIDGEGCISIARDWRERVHKYYYRLSLHIGLTNKELIEWFFFSFGGKISKRNLQLPNNDLYTWRMYGKEAALFILTTYPYLRIKRAQAEVAFEFAKREDGRGQDMNEDWELIGEVCYAKMKELNKRGIHKFRT